MSETNFELVNKGFFWLLLLIPLLAGYLWWRGNRLYPYLKISSIRGFVLAEDWVSKTRPVLWVLRLAAIACVIVAMTRPRGVEVSTQTRTGLGVDIVMSIDLSGSMLARDFKPSRLDALKKVATEFAEGRTGDRIGIVTYATESFTQTPLTTDKRIVVQTIQGLRQGLIGETTAIGLGLGTAINRLKDSEAKSKVIILLTDGENNRGEIAPLTAAEIARDQGIRVYTIGVGTRGTAPYPTVDFFGNPTVVQAKVQIDEKILGEIADLTGGRYFRATDNAKLQSIYDEINQLEKSKVEISQYTTYTEEYLRWAAAALALLLVEFLLRTLWLKSLP